MTNPSLFSSSTQAPVMPFGKCNGLPLDQLDDEYLLWLGCLNDLRQPLLGHVLREMGRRLAARPQARAGQP